MVIGNCPAFNKVTVAQRNKLHVLRENVADILDNGVFLHYTDHGVSHSDRMIEIVKQLIKPLNGNYKLNNFELFLLYSACYLHDIGMHYEAAGETKTIQDAMKSEGATDFWLSLPQEKRLDLLRRHHHELSAEMIMLSANSTDGVVGMYLSQDFEPELLAEICLSHGIDILSDEYHSLVTQDHPQVRRDLLCGLLRVADILDEVRDRAELVKARVLLLDTYSQMHWYRNYYTKQVTFSTIPQEATIWFDLPLMRHEEYSNILPALQMPVIQEELSAQQKWLAKYGLHWHAISSFTNKTRCTTRVMPEDVLLEMLKELHYRRKRIETRDRNTALMAYTEAEPAIERQLAQLREEKETIGEGEYLLRVRHIADILWQIGGRRCAWMTLHGAFQTHRASVSSALQAEIGVELAEKMLEDGWLFDVGKLLGEIAGCVDELNDNDPLKQSYWQLCARFAFDNAAANTVVVIEEAIRLANDLKVAGELHALRAEWFLLQGDTDAVLTLTPQSGGAS